MPDSLNPSALTRLTETLRPDWSRTTTARRITAGALVVLAAVAALRPDPRDDRTDIVVAARDLTPGVELTADDLRIESHFAASIPDGSQSNIEQLVGSTLAGPARRGEVLTDVRLLGPRLSESVAGPDARIVPLHLADTALLDLVRPGDVVDVLAAADTQVGNDARPQVVATDAVVVLVSEKQKGTGNASDRVVLVALPGAAANTVAGATLTQTVTLTFH